MLDLYGQVNTKSVHALLQERRGFRQVVLGFEQQADGDQGWPGRARTRANASADGTLCVWLANKRGAVEAVRRLAA